MLNNVNIQRKQLIIGIEKDLIDWVKEMAKRDVQKTPARWVNDVLRRAKAGLPKEFK